MSSFSLQKSFEKSLRASSTTYQVPITTPLKTEIHKGCTGKAHACGSIKSTNTLLINKPSTPKPKVKSDGKTLRKNSLSSETVSDSGSEISSWNSNKDSSPSSSAAPPLPPKPSSLKRTKSVNYGSSNGSSSTARRRTSDSIISADVPDNVRNGFRNGRLLSDAGDDKKVEHPEDVSKLRRTSSFRLKNVPPMIPTKPKVTPPPPPTPIKRNGSFNNRLRNSFRNKNPIFNWNVLWESSFASKMGGGNLKVLDKKQLEAADKVTKSLMIDYERFRKSSRKSFANDWKFIGWQLANISWSMEVCHSRLITHVYFAISWSSFHHASHKKWKKKTWKLCKTQNFLCLDMLKGVKWKTDEVA